eukprot:XP_001695624.1 predicted protein [Chlamydomonas reinhardtii]
MQVMQQRVLQARPQRPASLSVQRPALPHRSVLVRSGNEQQTTTAEQPSTSSTPSVEKDILRSTRQIAGTFAPRSSTKSKNPATKGTVLYDVFEWQSWICLVAGGLLSFNIIWPTDEPSIPRLLGMWSIWMFTIPSLRAKECMANEKDALNLLFVLVPLMNVTLPFLWKSFPFIFVSNVLALGGVYWWKGVWKEVYGIPFAYAGYTMPAPAATAAEQAAEQQEGGAEQ